jgi:hypothetical protein
MRRNVVSNQALDIVGVCSNRIGKVATFKKSESQIANQKSLEIEKKINSYPSAEAVLVSVDSLDAVRKAYPNYFLDTHVFLEVVADATRTLRPPPRSARSKKGQLSLF